MSLAAVRQASGLSSTISNGSFMRITSLTERKLCSQISNLRLNRRQFLHGPPLRQLEQDALERPPLNRLGQVKIEATLQGPSPVVRPSVSRERDQHRRIELRMLAQPPRDFIAVETWHGHIQQHRVGMILQDPLDSSRSIVNGSGILPMGPEELGQRVRAILHVVDNENTVRELIGRRRR